MGIIVGVNLYEENGKEYIEIDVPTYPIGISCKGVYYYRSGSTRQILTGPALEAFLMRRRGATWDNLPLPAFSLNDIDDSIVEHFKQWAAKRGCIDRSVLDEPKDLLMEKLHAITSSYPFHLVGSFQIATAHTPIFANPILVGIQQNKVRNEIITILTICATHYLKNSFYCRLLSVFDFSSYFDFLAPFLPGGCHQRPEHQHQLLQAEACADLRQGVEP